MDHELNIVNLSSAKSQPSADCGPAIGEITPAGPVLKSILSKFRAPPANVSQPKAAAPAHAVQNWGHLLRRAGVAHFVVKLARAHGWTRLRLAASDYGAAEMIWLALGDLENKPEPSRAVLEGSVTLPVACLEEEVAAPAFGR